MGGTSIRSPDGAHGRMSAWAALPGGVRRARSGTPHASWAEVASCSPALGRRPSGCCPHGRSSTGRQTSKPLPRRRSDSASLGPDRARVVVRRSVADVVDSLRRSGWWTEDQRVETSDRLVDSRDRMPRGRSQGGGGVRGAPGSARCHDSPSRRSAGHGSDARPTGRRDAGVVSPCRISQRGMPHMLHRPHVPCPS